MSNSVLEEIMVKMLDLDMEGSKKIAQLVVEGDGTTNILDAVNAVANSLQIVGRRFQDGEWFLAELVYAGEIAKEVMNILSPYMKAGPSNTVGTVVVGTVAGDLHDLGKNIFISYAQSAGLNVIDLGIDVPTNKFISSVKEHRPLALGMSCLLTSTDAEIGKVIEALKRENLRDKVKVIVGGAALTEGFARDVGADAFAPDAVTGTDIIKKWGA